jgi:outer membrane lipoprotein LolB
MRIALALAVAALVLTGCARTEVADDRLGYERRQAELAAIADWDIGGRLAVDTGERGYQARFSWSQRGNRLELLVRGILGARSFRVAGTEASLTVESRGETQVLTDPERQLSEMLGWWLPVTSIEHWLLGHADPDYDADSTRGAFDTLSELDQRDWRIRYQEYQLAEGRLVPRVITLTHASLELRLAILELESIGIEP